VRGKLKEAQALYAELLRKTPDSAFLKRKLK